MDAIDNSAGVDCSDHEVNIKILLDAIVEAGDMTEKQRNELLASMTDEVGNLVLRDNYQQTQAISQALATSTPWSMRTGSTAASSSCPTTRNSASGAQITRASPPPSSPYCCRTARSLFTRTS